MLAVECSTTDTFKEVRSQHLHALMDHHINLHSFSGLYTWNLCFKTSYYLNGREREREIFEEKEIWTLLIAD